MKQIKCVAICTTLVHNKGMNEHKNWYTQLVGDTTERSVAIKAGITTSTLNRQLKAGTLSAENVILIARAYGANPVAALTTTGYITAAEATKNLGDIAQLLPDRNLIAELARRIGVTSDELMNVQDDSPMMSSNVASFTRRNSDGEELDGFDPETMAAHADDEYIAPDDQFDA